MNTEQTRGSFEDISADYWWRFLLLGIILMFAGVAAIVVPAASTVAAVLTLGIILIVAGGVRIIQAFHLWKTDEFWLSLLAGILAVVVGIMFVSRTGSSVMVLTLMLAIYFFVIGTFRVVGGVAGAFAPYSGWIVFGGGVDIILGIVIFSGWPTTALWLIGLLVGINLLFAGLWALRISSALHTVGSAMHPRPA